MELIPIECGGCKAKLKIKAMPARMPTEVKCPKCGKTIPVGKGIPASPASAPAPASSTPPAPIPATQNAPVPPPPVAPAPESKAPPASSTAQLTPPPKPIGSPNSFPQANAPKKAAAPIVLGQIPDPASTGAILSVVCPTCKWQTKVAQALVGKKIKCKQCSGIIPVVSPEQAVPSAMGVVPAPPQVPESTTPVAPQIPPPPPALAPATEPEIQRRPPEADPSTPPVSPEPPTPPIAQWTAAETTIATSLTTSHTSPSTTVLVGEIATLKSKLEAAVRESTLSVQRLDEAETKVQQAELRAKEAENSLHELVGKAAIDAVTASRRIAELEARITALQQALATATQEFGNELEFAEKRVARLKDILASRDFIRTP